MDKIGLLAFIRPFYQKTLGFWALILIVGGVLMEGKQHVLLGRFFFKNPIAFWILPVCIIIFSLVHLRIQLGLLRSKGYLVFHHLGLFPINELRRFWTQIILANHSLLIGYFLFLSYFAWEQKNWTQGMILWLTGIGLVLFTHRKIQNTLHHPLKELVIRRPPVRWTFPRFTWIILSLRQNRPILLLLSKLLSLLLLNGFYYSFQTGSYDLRWLQFGILIVAYLQLPLLLEKTESEVQRQSWMLSLPLAMEHKIGYHLGSFGLLIFPELLFLCWKGWIAGQMKDYLILGILALSFLIALQLVVYKEGLSSAFLSWLVGIFFLFFLGIVFGLPWFLFSAPIAFLFLYRIRSAYQF